MWDYKQYNNNYIISLRNHTEIVGSIKKFCIENEIWAGKITGIGAVNAATLRFFDPESKKYVDKTFYEQMEILNLTGNISTMNGVVYIHMHTTLSGADYKALGGHLHSAMLNGAGEFIIETFDLKLERSFDPETGINLFDFNK